MGFLTCGGSLVRVEGLGSGWVYRGSMGVGNVWPFFDWQAGRMTDDSVTIDDDTPPFPGRATVRESSTW